MKPPPQISDKQLEEREHTIEQWKGRRCCPLQRDSGSADNLRFFLFKISMMGDAHPDDQHINANVNRVTLVNSIMAK